MRIFAVWCLGNPIHSPTVSTAKYWNIYKIKHVWVSTYLHIIFTGFLLIFTEEITLLNIEYSLVVWWNLFVCWPSLSRIIVRVATRFWIPWMPRTVLEFFWFWNCSGKTIFWMLFLKCCSYKCLVTITLRKNSDQWLLDIVKIILLLER